MSNAVKIYLLHTNIHKHTHIYIYVLYTYIYIYISEDILILNNMNSYNYGCYETHIFLSLKVLVCVLLESFWMPHHNHFAILPPNFPRRCGWISLSFHSYRPILVDCCPTYPLEKEFQRQDGNLPFNMEITTFFIAIFYPKIRGKPGGKFTAVNVNYRGKRQIIQ